MESLRGIPINDLVYALPVLVWLTSFGLTRILPRWVLRAFCLRFTLVPSPPVMDPADMDLPENIEVIAQAIAMAAESDGGSGRGGGGGGGWLSLSSSSSSREDMWHAAVGAQRRRYAKALLLYPLHMLRYWRCVVCESDGDFPERRGGHLLSSVLSCFGSLLVHQNRHALVSSVCSYLYVLSVGKACSLRYEAIADLAGGILGAAIANAVTLLSVTGLDYAGRQVPNRGSLVADRPVLHWLKYGLVPVLQTAFLMLSASRAFTYQFRSQVHQANNNAAAAATTTANGGGASSSSISNMNPRNGVNTSFSTNTDADNPDTNRPEGTTTGMDGESDAAATAVAARLFDSGEAAADSAEAAAEERSNGHSLGRWARAAGAIEVTAPPQMTTTAAATLATRAVRCPPIAYLCGGEGVAYSLAGFRFAFRGDVAQLQNTALSYWIDSLQTYANMWSHHRSSSSSSSSSNDSHSYTGGGGVGSAARGTNNSVEPELVTMAGTSAFTSLDPATGDIFFNSASSVELIHHNLIAFVAGCGVGLAARQGPLALRLARRTPLVSLIVNYISPPPLPPISIPAGLMEATLTDLGVVRLRYQRHRHPRRNNISSNNAVTADGNTNDTNEGEDGVVAAVEQSANSSLGSGTIVLDSRPVLTPAEREAAQRRQQQLERRQQQWIARAAATARTTTTTDADDDNDGDDLFALPPAVTNGNSNATSNSGSGGDMPPRCLSWSAIARATATTAAATTAASAAAHGDHGNSSDDNTSPDPTTNTNTDDDTVDIAVPPQCFCPITRCLMADPVRTTDGFTYDREAITAWLRVRSTSPMTNLVLADAGLETNREVYALVQGIVAAYEEFAAEHHLVPG